MPAGSPQNGSAPPPTLEQLEDCLVHRNLDQLRQLRTQLDWAPKCDKLVPPTQTRDHGLDRLNVMEKNFGPKCLACKNASGDTLVHLTAKTCTSESTMDQLYSKLGGDKAALECFSVKGAGKNTAVHAAAENHNGAALKWLVRMLGSSCLKLKNGVNNEVVHIVAQYQGADSMELIKAELGAAYFKQPGELDRTPFHCAALNKRSCEALRWLIKEVGSSPLTAKDKQHNTPVHLAAESQDEGSMEMLKEALGNHMFTLDGCDGQSVVHFAARNTITNSALVWCVKELGSECLLALDSKKRTPLHFAAQYQSDQSVEMAVSALGESCLTTVDGTSRSVTHYAAMNKTGNAALRWIVAKLGPKCLQLRDANSRMPLHLVAWNQGLDSLCFVRNCVGLGAFYLHGRNDRIIAHYAAENADNKEQLLSWIVREIGPQCMLVPDLQDVTPAKCAGYV